MSIKYTHHLTRLESRVDASTMHVETRDKKMRQELAICKTVVSAQVMATHESSEDNHTVGGGEEVSPSTPRNGKGKVPYTRKYKGKQWESTPRLRCFICDGPHLARECLKREAPNALIKKSEKEEEDARLGSMQMLSALQFMSKASLQGSEARGQAKVANQLRDRIL